MKTTIILGRRLLSITGVVCLAWATQADTLDQLWTIAPGDRDYVTTGNTERGIALNPASKNVLFVSRAGGPQVYVLNSIDGSDGSAELGAPNTLSQNDIDGNAVVAGGTFTLNLVGAGADGAVYACNLTTDINTSPFKIYRWADTATTTPASVAFEGDPTSGKGGSGQDIRFGDNFAARGSGAATQLAAMSRNGKYLVIFTTTDGTAFTANTLTTDASGKGGIGLAFGDGNTIWSKINGQMLVQLQFDLGAGTAKIIQTISDTIIANAITGIAYDPATKRFAAVNYSAHTLAVFDFSDLQAPTRIGDTMAFPTANANGNGTSAASLDTDKVVAVDSNNGMLAAKVTISTVVEPPAIDTHPASQTVLEGGVVQFGVIAHGTKPLSYQWKFNGSDIEGQTNAALNLANVASSQGGDYSVVVRNSAGEIASSTATLTVVALAKSDALTLKWKLAPGDKPWLNQDNTQRGLAYNPATGNVLVISRSDGDKVYVLDGATGRELRILNVDPAVVFGGTFAINMLGISDDGAVYVCNLTTDGTTNPFLIYRWASDAADAIPEMVYNGDPGNGTTNRWGDSFDVRGAGNSTQLLAASRFGNAVAVFSTSDGAQFTPALFSIEEASGGNFGLSVAFGAGNTFFGVANGQVLRHASFDPNTGAGAVVHSYSTGMPTNLTTIAWDGANQFLAGVALANPDNVQLFDMANMESPALIDQEFCAADNPNINGTGQADFGGNRFYVLSSNNGIVAFDVKKPSLATQPVLSDPKLAEAGFEFIITGQAGRTYGIEATADLKTWVPVDGVSVPGPSGKAVAKIPQGATTLFYRAVVK